MKTEIVALMAAVFFGLSIGMGLQFSPNSRATYYILSMWIAGFMYLQILQTLYLAELKNQ